MSATRERPDAEHYTWRSNSSGDVEQVSISPDDPQAAHPGPYHIGVFGAKQSVFTLVGKFVKPQVELPPRPPKQHPRGYKEIGKHLRGSATRVTEAASGSTPAASASSALVLSELNEAEALERQGQ